MVPWFAGCPLFSNETACGLPGTDEITLRMSAETPKNVDLLLPRHDQQSGM
jgi:hypothetical protein